MRSCRGWSVSWLGSHAAALLESDVPGLNPYIGTSGILRQGFSCFLPSLSCAWRSCQGQSACASRTFFAFLWKLTSLSPPRDRPLTSQPPCCADRPLPGVLAKRRGPSCVLALGKVLFMARPFLPSSFLRATHGSYAPFVGASGVVAWWDGVQLATALL